MTELSREKRYQIIDRVNWVCTAVDAVLSIFKLGVGFMARSPALIADGLHSLSDLGSDILALILGSLAKHGPDEDHPYGHARYETMGTAVLGTALVMVGFGIGFENIKAMIQGESVTPHWIALVAVFVSIVTKELLFHYTMRNAKLTRSNLLEANAWHSRSDSLSSIVVFLGVLGSMAGYPIIEYCSALVVAALIGKMGFTLAWDAMQDLIDRGVSNETKQAYISTLKSVEDIVDVHLLRSRIMGTDVFIDAHVQVLPRLSVSEAHQINDFSTAKLKTEHPEITDVTLHIDFESDHLEKKTKLVPKRSELNKALEQSGIAGFEHMYLHYSNDLLYVELVFNDIEHLEDVSAKAKKLTQSEDWINSIKILVSQP